jgi:hypothetical protein
MFFDQCYVDNVVFFSPDKWLWLCNVCFFMIFYDQWLWLCSVFFFGQPVFSAMLDIPSVTVVITF